MAESIMLKAIDFYKYVAKLAADPTIEAIEVSIFDYEEESGECNKYLTIDILECGGAGLSTNEESLKEMTEDEILNIP